MPWAIVLTTEAYKTFVVLPEVTGAITELQKALDDWTYSTDLSCLTSASKRCVAKITKVGMPVSLEQLVRIYIYIYLYLVKTAYTFHKVFFSDTAFPLYSSFHSWLNVITISTALFRFKFQLSIVV